MTQPTDRMVTALLTPAQQDGLSCVECGCDFLRNRVPHVPVGRSQTGSQIFMCSSHEYQAGLDDGVKDAAHCNTRDDVMWYLRVVADNLVARRPHYVAGYTDAFACLL